MKPGPIVPTPFPNSSTVIFRMTWACADPHQNEPRSSAAKTQCFFKESLLSEDRTAETPRALERIRLAEISAVPRFMPSLAEGRQGRIPLLLQDATRLLK